MGRVGSQVYIIVGFYYVTPTLICLQWGMRWGNTLFSGSTVCNTHSGLDTVVLLSNILRFGHCGFIVKHTQVLTLEFYCQTYLGFDTSVLLSNILRF